MTASPAPPSTLSDREVRSASALIAQYIRDIAAQRPAGG